VGDRVSQGERELDQVKKKRRSVDLTRREDLPALRKLNLGLLKGIGIKLSKEKGNE